MRLPRVPRERVIDAAPLAIVIIMVSFPYFIPLGVPFSLLHMWLWLRYPRSKSRYLTFAAITGFILFLFIVVPICMRTLYICLSADEVAHKIIDLNYIPLILTSLLTGGILPILYRLSSRRSLTAREDVATQVAESHTRTGISDLFVLITISAESLGWLDCLGSTLLRSMHRHGISR